MDSKMVNQSKKWTNQGQAKLEEHLNINLGI